MTHTTDALSMLDTLKGLTAGSPADVVKIFPMAEGVNQAAFVAKANSFGNITLHELLLAAAAKNRSPEREFVGQVSINYWQFATFNPYTVLWALYKQL